MLTDPIGEKEKDHPVLRYYNYRIIFSRKHFYFCIYIMWITHLSQQPVKVSIAITCQTLPRAIAKHHPETAIIPLITTIIIIGLATFWASTVLYSFWKPQVPLNATFS